MGHLSEAGGSTLLLTPVDRTTASNSGGGMTPQSEHIILLGADAGAGLNAQHVIALGFQAAGAIGSGWGGLADPPPDIDSVVIGHNSAESVSGANAFGLVLIGNDIQPTNTTQNSVMIGQHLDVSPYTLRNSVLVAGSPVNYSGAGVTRRNSLIFVTNDAGFDLNQLVGDGADNSIILQSPHGFIAQTVVGGQSSFWTGDLDTWSMQANNDGISLVGNVEIALAGSMAIPDTVAFEVFAQGNIAYSEARNVSAADRLTRFGWTGTEIGLGAVLGTACANGAAAQVGTLTNAPTAGNPTKWIPFNDNGTRRYFPAW